MMMPSLLRYFWFHSVYSLAASCSLQSAVCGMQSAVCGVPSAVCGLQSANVIHRSAINLASQQKTTKLFFSTQVRKQFKLLAVPFKSLRCCLRSDKLVNCHVWKFYNDLFLNCRVSSWPDLSIKSYFWMVSSRILLRSLRVYILKLIIILFNLGE